MCNSWRTKGDRVDRVISILIDQSYGEPESWLAKGMAGIERCVSSWI